MKVAFTGRDVAKAAANDDMGKFAILDSINSGGFDMKGLQGNVD